MIETDKRKAIYLLHQEGMRQRSIFRGLAATPCSGDSKAQGQAVRAIRKDKQAIDPDLLRRLHQECEGLVQRMHEKLAEEEGFAVKYSDAHPDGARVGLGPATPGPLPPGA